jgi:hypothetical protein
MEKNENKLQTSNVIFEKTINCIFSLKPASTVFPAKFSFKFSSPKVCENLAIRPLFKKDLWCPQK